MASKPSIIERAYQLARSGEVIDILHIKMKLNAEGYLQIDSHLDGSKIRGDLRRLIAETPSMVDNPEGRRLRAV